MLAVTQLEVYVLERGRWTLHARYAGNDQKEAMWDARSTEVATGFPAKVVRETFFPELNDSERITTYISPNAKKAVRSQPVGTAPRPRPQARVRTQAQGPRKLSAAQMMLRILVAAAFSVIAAAVMAGVIKYVLSSFAGIGITVSPAATSMIMTYSWVAMFLLFFFSLFRSRLPLHRILADMWQASAKPRAQNAAARIKPVKFKLKPKHDRGPFSPETLREWQDLRMRRGDPDIFATPDDLAPELPQVNDAGQEIAKREASAETTPQAAKVTAERKAQDAIADAAAPEKKAAEKAEKPAPDKAALEKAAADKAAEDKAVQERVARAKEKAAKEKAAADKAAQDRAALVAKEKEKEKEKEKAQDVAPPPVLDEKDDFAHLALARFITDVVKPAAAGAMRDDPVARRGIALAIAGAVDGIAARPEAIALDASALLTWGLSVAGLSQNVAELFLQSQDAYVRQPANQTLVATGQGLISDMIPLQSPDLPTFIDAMASAFAAWRTPFGQPGVLVSETADPLPGMAEAPFTAEEPASARQGALMPARQGELMDVFLLTELRPRARHDDPVQDDARMTSHNDRVRARLTDFGGVEVKHTGKGIFARFTDPAAALSAAKALQRELGAAAAFALIGNADAGEDPVLSPHLFLRAETAVASTGDGQASVEAHVIGEDQRLGQPTDLVILAAPSAAGEAMVA